MLHKRYAKDMDPAWLITLSQAGDYNAMAELVKRARAQPRQSAQWKGMRDWMHELEHSKDPAATFVLAGMVHDGYGVPKDPGRALELLEKSFRAGHRPALWALVDHEMAHKNHLAAAMLLQEAVHMGVAEAAARLGLLFLGGKVKSADPNHEALRWFLKGSLLGSADCDLYAGRCIYQVDEAHSLAAMAIPWLRRAFTKLAPNEDGLAPLACAQAARLLSDIYRHGAKDMAPDPARARAWQELALRVDPASGPLAEEHLAWLEAMQEGEETGLNLRPAPGQAGPNS
jgi:TPR repeat protein